MNYRHTALTVYNLLAKVNEMKNKRSTLLRLDMLFLCYINEDIWRKKKKET